MFIRYIEERAEAVLKETDCVYAPIDVFLCGERLGVKINELEIDDEVSGLFVMKDKVAYIGYNKSQALTRQRFTIAHELGHFVLHAKNTSLFIDKDEKVLYRNTDSSSGEHLKEIEANAFAAALLMPKTLLLQEIQTNDLKRGYNLTDLCQKFGVSERAMTIRLTNLGLIDYGLFS